MISYATPKDHAEAIFDRFAKDGKAKYLRGGEAHGGRLYRKPVLRYLYDEVLDLPSYLLTLIEQTERLKVLISEAYWANEMNPVIDLHLTAAMNLLTCGNEDGTTEEEREVVNPSPS